MQHKIQFNSDTRVVKSNELIQSRMNWTKLEHRVVAMLIAQLKKSDEQFSEQRVYIKDIADLSGRSGKSLYDQAEEICQKLLDQKVHVRTETDDGRRRYKGYNCMSTCEYVEGSGYIEAKFNDDMRPFLLQLKRRFTQYSLMSFMQLSSQHSMRIYELLKMRQGLRYLRISVEELREILCCEHTYKRFTDFRRWVLDNAREELKEKADIYFNYTVERDGQRPVRVNFAIKANTNDQLEKRDPELIQAGEGKESKDIGVIATVDESSSATPRFNVFAMVLAEMTQKELDGTGEDTIRTTIEQARSDVQRQHGELGAANQATYTYRRTLALLREDR